MSSEFPPYPCCGALVFHLNLAACDAYRHGPQPAPRPVEGPAVWDLVIDDMRARDRFGTAKHGERKRANDGRDALKDAYQEALDLACYLRTAMLGMGDEGPLRCLWPTCPTAGPEVLPHRSLPGDLLLRRAADEVRAVSEPTATWPPAPAQCDLRRVLRGPVRPDGHPEGGMTAEERIAARLHRADAKAVRGLWRAEIGRLPRAHEARVAALTERHGLARMTRSVYAVRDACMRRTADRWAFFLALFCEAP